jgi:hypothetical protein
MTEAADAAETVSDDFTDAEPDATTRSRAVGAVHALRTFVVVKNER